jgi:poly(hydroxyalkanoate) depolymerase family esterase
MAGLGKTTFDLHHFRRRWEEATDRVASPGTYGTFRQGPGRLREVTGFGSNPGGLKMMAYVPRRLAESPALVVVLHGCTQSAESYDTGAGWTKLADRHGFVVLLPEQPPQNNPKRCFNWFQPGDTVRGEGEVLSIHQMIGRMAADHGIDPKRIYVTGLSAGGAMASAMLATYPETFAGGAIIGGLPYGAANNVHDAFHAMFHGEVRTSREWGDRVRGASPHQGAWPLISLWHGTADKTVVPRNAEELLKQWTDVHGVPEAPSHEELTGNQARQVWLGSDGTPVIEAFLIEGMAHGTPLDIREGAAGQGVAGPFLLDAEISSTWHIARFWGLTDVTFPDAPERNGDAAEPHSLVGDVKGVILAALKKAGLIRD